jgi:hypothetical protein
VHSYSIAITAACEAKRSTGGDDVRGQGAAGRGGDVAHAGRPYYTLTRGARFDLATWSILPGTP